jgi:hypothetical protein
MGMIQKLVAAFRGESAVATATGMRRATAPVPDDSLPSREVIGEPLPSPEPQSAPQVPEDRAEPEEQAEPRPAGVKKVMLDEAGLSVLDLRELPSSRFRIVGSAYWVTDSGRYKHGGTGYLLVREPKNKWDANAVAVYGKGRKIGHLTEAKAAALAPIFDDLGFGAYRVGGAAPAPNSIRMWVDLPALPKLRAFAKTVGKAAV